MLITKTPMGLIVTYCYSGVLGAMQAVRFH